MIRYFLICFLPFQAFGIESKAKQAFMIDLSTKTVLFDKNSKELMFPSSMTKMMTLYMIFERLRSKSLKLEDTFKVSEKAWKVEGSKMFLQVDSKVTLENLIRGISTVSANDACITFMETLFGSEEEGAKEMNKKAKELGMKNTTFQNSTGLPHPEHTTTAFDLALLGDRLINDFPEYQNYLAEAEFEFNGIKQKNNNTLLKSDLGVDGIKTGHTKAAGYGITLSAKQKNRRLILVVNGYKTKKERVQDSEQLLSWAFREFDVYKFFPQGTVINVADVWLGNYATVPLIAHEDVMLTLPRNVYSSVKMEIVYQGPLDPPIQKDQYVGDLIITAPNFQPRVIPLYAAHDVGHAPFFKRIPAAIHYLVWGKN